MAIHGHHVDDDAASPMAVNSVDDRYYDRGTNSIRSVDDGVMEEYSEKPPPPPRRRFYRQKRYWIICSIITVIIVVVVVLLIIYVFFPMIAQSLINQAGIEVGDAQITFSPPDNLSSQKREAYNMNTTFFMNMTSTLKNTGPFSADIKFHNPIEVYYNDTILGTITLPSAHVSGGSGELKAFTAFNINNTDFFASFSKDMLADKTFTWKMKGKLDITALSRSATINLDKEIVLNGMDGFPEVKITSFQLPSDAAEGGINVELGTQLTSPSPIGVQLGTIVLNVGYQGLYLGQVSASNVNLAHGPNDILLKGVLVKQTDPTALAKVSELFSNYVAGKISQTTATGVSCAPDGTNAITWLSEGFRSVQLNVGLGNSEPLNIIQGVSMGYLDLKFSPDAPYAPVSSAPNVIADFQIPFGFSLNITQVSQNLTIGTNETGNFATLSVPWVPAQSDQKAGKLQFAMTNIPIAGISGKESQYDDFTYSLTASDAYSFQVGGNASTITETPIGQITLAGVTFEVPTTLHGLQFLNSTPTEVLGVDVTGGTTDNLLLAINVSMTNPSDINITAGNVQFAFLSSGEQLGNVFLNDLTLVRGPNQLTASSTFNPKGSQIGSNLLSTFVMGQNNAVSIAGNSESTAIASLEKAFAAITIDTSLPGLKSQLIQGAKLTVNPDSPKNGIVGVAVSIANPFSASLSITKVVSSATYQGMPVGNIDQDISNSPIVIGGHSTVQSNPLNMQMNIEPAAVALLLRQLAVAEGLDTRALDALLGMGGFQIAGQEDVSPSADLFANFNISQYVMQAMQSLHADLQLLSGLKVGDYTTDLQFAQNNVTVQTDESVTRLIPIVGQPIVQQLVDGAKLGFETIVLSSPTDTSFQVQMKGSITGTGPFSATISFPSPLTISWQGRNIVSVNMPNIQTQPDVGAQFDVSASSTVLDQAAMADFSGYLINNENFQWEITTKDVAVTALGFTFTNITMDKFVTLDGANGFKDAVKILSFDLPSNDPAGGITMTANTTIANPSQVGFTLNSASFAAYYKDVYLGPLASDGQAVIPPKATGNIAMKGRLVPQDSQEGLDVVTEVFENYLIAKDTPLEVKGVSGSGPNGEVGWLTTGFKTLDIQNVILPGPDTPPELIPSITMMDMELDFTKDTWAPPAGSKEVQAQLKNPFGFPLGVSQLNMDVTVSYGGSKTGELQVPDEKATTSSTGVVTTSFSDIPLKIFDDAHDTFSSFVKALTSKSNVTFGLAGSTNAVTETAIGSLKLDNITFDVDSALAGFANFGGKNDILSLSVTGGTSEYIIISLTIGLNNPSKITAVLGDLMLSVQMNEFNAAVGNVYLKSVTMQPGNNTMEAEMHMGEDSSNEQALKQLLSDYMTHATVPLTILGTEKSTSIEPLQQAMSTVKLATSMTGIPNTLVVDTTVYADLLTLLFTKKAEATVTLQNPLKTKFSIQKIQAEVMATELGKTFKVGTIDYDLPSPFTVEAGGQGTSDKWPVSVNLGLDTIGPLLAMILDPNAKVDLTQNATITVGDGFNSVLYYYQTSVPCKIVTDGISLQRSSSSNDSNPLSQLPSDMINAIPSNILSQLGFSQPNSSMASAASSAASQAHSAVSAGASAAASAADNVASGVKSAVSDILPDKTESQTPTPDPTSDSSSSSDDDKSSSTSPEEAKSTSSSSSDGPHFLWPFKI